jgi:1-deoxy-D-xylulose-5-phosphate reductoisomerase
MMSAIVGAAGLEQTMAGVRQGATIALANKECLVAAGEVFLAECARHNARLLPVDSEHNAIFQLVAHEAAPIERLLLTASGGPFRTWSTEQMAAASPKQAVAHPNWSMGARISIDSASMFNKALEMIEARHLFDVSPDQIEVVVHPQSIIHSMIGYADGSILAHLGPSDMRVAIGYALAWPERPNLPVDRLDFADLARLDFEAPDESRFPSLRLARESLVAGGLTPCILNAAHEIALDGFIAGQIGFLDMACLVEDTISSLGSAGRASSVTDVLDMDAEARRAARKLLEKI